MDWKALYRVTLMVLGWVFMPSVVPAQENLIFNSGFEVYGFCPNGLGDIEGATGWVAVRGSVDYFHSCGTFGSGGQHY